jgi:(p)ppGpp synthase/HD superfamily hydrolase
MRLQNAIHHANKAHLGRVDKQGFNYFVHPVCVAAAVAHRGENSQVAAFLHDVKEDHPDYWESADLEWKLNPRQFELLLLLTHLEADTYREYIERICEDDDACYIKLADIGHNTSSKRKLEGSTLADDRYFPYASLIVSALLEWHGQPLDEIERVLYAFDHD